MKRSALLLTLSLTSLLACGGTKEEPAVPVAEAPPASDKAIPVTTSAADDSASKAQPDSSSAPTAPTPPPSSDTPASEETRTVSVIQEIVKQHRGTVRECYKKALKDHPEIAGNLTIAFTINPKGKVTSATVNSQRSDFDIPEVNACAIDMILKLEFPASSRGRESSVNYPFNLTPGNH